MTKLVKQQEKRDYFLNESIATCSNLPSVSVDCTEVRNFLIQAHIYVSLEPAKDTPIWE